MGDASSALRDAAARLAATSDTARLDAELLLAYALGMDRAKLLLDLPQLTAPPQYIDLIARRESCEPVAYIIGSKEFWGLDFAVTPDVLIPRPDSELLIEEAVEQFRKTPPQKLLDLGTGSGALLLAALHEFPDAVGLATDNSAAALEVAHNNADVLGLSLRAKFLLCDWTLPEWTAQVGGDYDLILANPPYIAANADLMPDIAGFEPHQALFAGTDGLNDYNIIIPALPELLSTKGIALVEIGFDQQKAVTALAQAAGLQVRCRKDLSGHDRMLVITR